MNVHPSQDDIVAANPHIDAKELEESRESLKKLRTFGLRKVGYRLGAPFVRRRVVICETDKTDSRTVIVGRSPQSSKR